jgi:hypothetical protein
VGGRNPTTRHSLMSVYNKRKEGKEKEKWGNNKNKKGT